MKLGSSRIGVILSILLVCSGFLAFAISTTFVRTSLIGRNIWIGYGEGNVTIHVNETVQVANVTIYADKIEIPHFNTHDNPVSIIINTMASPHPILNYSKVSGTNITGFVYPEGDPSQSLSAAMSIGWFYLYFYYEGADTQVNFEYQAFAVAHADNLVTVTYPGYYSAFGFGVILLSFGFLVAVITLYVKIRTKSSISCS